MDTETLLRRVDPAHLVEIPGPGSPEGQRIRNDVLSGRPLPESTGDSKTRRNVSLSVGVLATVAAAVVLLLVLMPTSVGPSKASAALSRLAVTAASVPTSLSQGQYAYTEVETPVMVSVGTPKSGGTPFTEYLTGTVQTWVGTDGSGRRVTTTDPTPHFFTAADRALWVAAGSPAAVVPPNETTTVETFGPNTASEVNGPIPLYNVQGLPTDPTALTEILDNENPGAQSLGALPAGIKALDFVSSCSTPECTLFERAVALLQGPDIGSTPALRQALFDVLSNIPGVEYLGNTTDSAGQTGVGLALVQYRPAQTTKVVCSNAVNGTGGTLYGPGGTTVHPTQDTTITKTTTENSPASTTTFRIVVDPLTTTLLSSERTFSPSVVTAAPNPCGPPALQKPQTTELTPTWSDVVASGVVDSDTAIPFSASN